MPIQWQGCYGGSEHDLVWDIIQSENGYLVLGESRSNDGDITNSFGERDIWIVNIDNLGGILWERCYGGSETDYPGNIIMGFDGNYYFSGWVGSNDGDVQSGNHGDYDTWVVKIDASGEIIWERCYGGSGREQASNIKLLNDGNLLISSNSTSDDGDLPAHYGAYDAWLFVISPEGEILKNAVFGNDLNNSVFDAIETLDGSYFFTCGASSTNGMVQGTYHGGMLDVWVVKLDSNMNIEWQMLYGGSESDYGFRGIKELSDGYLFLAQTNSNDGDVSGYHGTPGESTDIWAVRIDSEGNIIWQRCLGGYLSEYSGSLHQTEDGGFIIFGETKSNDGDVSGNNSWSQNSDIWMVKLSAEGELIWQECFGGYGNERIYNGVIQKSDNNWIIAGRADNNSYDVNCNLHGYEDYWVFEIKDTTTNIITNEANDYGIKVYPNPAKDYVVFEHALSLKNDYYNIIISNITGQVVHSISLKRTQGQTVCDTRQLKPGVYFYTIKSTGFTDTGKLIIL